MKKATDSMAKKMSKASKKVAKADTGVGHPKKGEKYRCDECGMEIKVTADCGCQGQEGVHFHCCGQELTPA